MAHTVLASRIDGVSDYLENNLVGEQATMRLRTQGGADDEDRAVSVGVGLGNIGDRDGCRSRSAAERFFNLPVFKLHL